MKKQIVPLITLLVTGAGFSIFAWLGIFGRMFTDDYCYSYAYRTLGLLGTLRGYYYITTFTAHRYALTFFEWIIDRFGIAGIQWMPLIFMLIWGFGIYQLITEINERSKMNLTRLEMAASAIFLLFFSLYLAPNLYQSLYWRTGILPYTAPLIAGIWLLVYLLRKQQSNSIVKYIILGLGSFIAAGFSEAGAVFIASFFGVVIIWSLWAWMRNDKAVWKGLGRPSLIVIGVILAALLIMYLSPVNVQRQASYQAPASFGVTFVSALRFAFDFIWLSIRTQPTPNIIFFIFTAAAAYFSKQPRELGIKTSLISAAGAVIFMTIIIWILHLPSAYVEKAPPADRTLIMARFTFLAAEMILASLAGWWAASFVRRVRGKRDWWNLPILPRLAALASLAMLMIGWIYMIRIGINVVIFEFPRQQKVAEVWDQRDRQIKSESMDGKMVIQVQPIDSQYVGGLLELYPTPNWINICAAQYYGVKEIQATLGW